MKKITLVMGICILAVMVQCQKEKDTSFLITNNSVGKLEKISLVRDLDLIFYQDSIVKDTMKLASGLGARSIKVYEKGGNHLLTLTPSLDSIPKIQNVRVNDPRFETEKGIGLNSTFKDIKEKYTIQKIVTSINNIIIFVKDSDVYFTIDKSQLPESLRYVSSPNIEAVQVPDNAKIKYLMIAWE
ncbi:hypothetical protein R3X28_15695 [Maribacter sp. TH_r10]|uniref:Uncharacterized protein n=1 Tax=Maribacter luteus TaxID=2594478 RepID=A0A6I2MM04_9FLAO|nr:MULTISPECIES: hypothetical protein [Maribacter]MDV7140335.1 hypothetical protein [Maribacter sp. TH_r10]MRX63194.1 hypothetical protein [Maribacter luteus]|tara:strand:+ start:682 stop:1236 length:555 start_codon:yes stop_codon:yes gene_type:complete